MQPQVPVSELEQANRRVGEALQAISGTRTSQELCGEIRSRMQSLLRLSAVGPIRTTQTVEGEERTIVYEPTDIGTTTTLDLLAQTQRDDLEAKVVTQSLISLVQDLMSQVVVLKARNIVHDTDQAYRNVLDMMSMCRVQRSELRREMEHIAAQLHDLQTELESHLDASVESKIATEMALEKAERELISAAPVRDPAR